MCRSLVLKWELMMIVFFFQAEDGIRDIGVTGVQTCALPIFKEADLNRIDVPEDYEVLDATALGRRLGFKGDTVLAYLSRRHFRRIPRPNRQLAMGPIWYEKRGKEWEVKEDQAAGK